jgi:predicted acylesterase/phospholipase RssA
MRPARFPLVSELWFFVAAICFLLAGCASLTRSDAVPADQQHRATVLGSDNLRYWADQEDQTDFRSDAVAALAREQEWRQASGQKGPLPAAEFLAISGGGEDGAFGAGLLVGWTAAGTRPQFKGVTGISTGALTAPFAFLGSDYDDELREVYTKISADDVLQQRWMLAAVYEDAMADTTPLRKTIARYFDQDLLAKIAEEHAKGRILLIGTTNLDARRPIIWNIGKIAASGHPKALELVHSILVASAAIPGAFPPVLIDVEVDGKTYQEMHVDGGASAQVFVYPPSLDIRQLDLERGSTRERRLYVIRNARLDPDWAQVERRTFSIASRAVSSLIQTQGVGDLYRIYMAAQRDRIDYNLAYIPETFKTPLTKPFDSEYMNQLFKVGYDLGAAGYPWAKLPPGFTAPEIEPPVAPPQRQQKRAKAASTK